MKKKFIAFVLLLVIAVSSLSVASSAINSYGIGVNIDGVKFEGSSYEGGIDIKNNTTFVGVRKFAGAM